MIFQSPLFKRFWLFVHPLFSAYSNILFMQSARVGAVLFALGFLQPNVALSGLIAVLTVLVFARLIEMSPNYLEQGYYLYNPLLVGMSIGFLFQLGPITGFFIITAAILTLLVTIALQTLFAARGVPILSLPFAIISSVVYLAAYQYGNLFIYELPHFSFSYQTLEILLPLWVAGFFKALGTILFLPNVVAGGVIFLMLLIVSRIMGLLAVSGYCWGAFVHSMLGGSLHQALNDPYAFNTILVSIAVGGVFFIPSIRSYTLSLIAVAITILTIHAAEVFLTVFKIPVFTLPFNITVICFLFSLKQIGYSYCVKVIKKNPERTLGHYLSTRHRFQTEQIRINPPFVGKWFVYQGFDDVWTHKGVWRYALDFIVHDKEGNSYKNRGTNLEDYYAFNRPVIAPVSGYVVEAINHIHDNPIDQPNSIDNWGNTVIIQQDLTGIYVSLSHFAKSSLKCKKGDYVELGQVLGLCGNSGYSAQPHIHLQAQTSPVLGAATSPFIFTTYQHNSQMIFYQTPKKEQEISGFFIDKLLDRHLSFTLDETLVFECIAGRQKGQRCSWTVCMEPISGQFYFVDEDGNTLLFAKAAGFFYCYDYHGKDDSLLRLMFLTLPRMPLVRQDGLSWQDSLPLNILHSGISRAWGQFMASFYHAGFIHVGCWGFKGKNRIEGYIDTGKETIKTALDLDEHKGIQRLSVDSTILQRVENAISK
ncbi:MAG: urea transporter [Magnetococcales bacterium]|nr:urea transporter [Magnetococcales bacterium]